MGGSEQGRQRTGWSGKGRAHLAVIGVAVLASGAAALASGAAGKGLGASLGSYATHGLVSDQAGKADVRDPKLVNAWGLSFGTKPATPAWVADNGTGVSTLYQGGVGSTPVKKLGLTVKVPGGVPTGTVFNGSRSFVVKSGGKKGPANFLFSSMSSRITAWSQNVPPLASASTEARVPGATFTGLAIANTSKGPRLYAPDFSKGRVDVWDGKFMRVHRKHAFSDPRIPNRYAPFGIDTVQGHIVVTYAKAGGYSLAAQGPGQGFVDMFSKSGKLLDRFASHGALNAPWGVAMAPQGFGGASGDMLIGNFGDGRINVYDPKTETFLGPLKNAMGAPIAIPGLWALEFGNGVIGTPKTLLFTAGPTSETHGLLGEIKPG
jgi:uncharacterized protein (TIGR03118 family)